MHRLRPDLIEHDLHLSQLGVKIPLHNLERPPQRSVWLTARPMPVPLVTTAVLLPSLPINPLPVGAPVYFAPEFDAWRFHRQLIRSLSSASSSLRTEYSICARNSFSGAIEGRPSSEYMSSNSGDISPSALSTIARIARSGCSFRTRVSGDK